MATQGQTTAHQASMRIAGSVASPNARSMMISYGSHFRGLYLTSNTVKPTEAIINIPVRLPGVRDRHSTIDDRAACSPKNAILANSAGPWGLRQAPASARASAAQTI